MKDLYDTFAYDYDEFGGVERNGEEQAFFQELFKQYEVESVLDCACGTGQHLMLFSDMGLDAAGSDYSRAMLDVAGRNLAGKGVSVTLGQCDFRYLDSRFDATFDAVVCLSTSLPHLHTDDDLITALVSMHERLRNGGILVLTQGTTQYNLSQLPPIEVVVNRDDFTRVFVKESDGTFLTIHVVDIYHSDKRREHSQYDMVYRILLDSDYRRLLSEAGFDSVQIFGDYAMTPYDELTSRRLIVVAQKGVSGAQS